MNVERAAMAVNIIASIPTDHITALATKDINHHRMILDAVNPFVVNLSASRDREHVTTVSASAILVLPDLTAKMILMNVN